MKDGHFHFGVEAVLFAGLSAIVVINLLRLGLAPIASRDDRLGTIGKSAAALVHF